MSKIYGMAEAHSKKTQNLTYITIRDDAPSRRRYRRCSSTRRRRQSRDPHLRTG